MPPTYTDPGLKFDFSVFWQPGSIDEIIHAQCYGMAFPCYSFEERYLSAGANWDAVLLAVFFFVVMFLGVFVGFAVWKKWIEGRIGYMRVIVKLEMEEE